MRIEADVAVVGGGPAGSTLAALLAQRDFDVVLLEKEKFPRHHIGESLIPGVLDVLDESGALPTVEDFGFLRKEGGIFKWGANEEPWSFYFDEAPQMLGKFDYAYQVTRADFDKILLDHARGVGVNVMEGVEAIPSESMGLSYLEANSIYGDQIRFSGRETIVDCSGMSSFMSKSFHRRRKFDSDLRNVAMYRYFIDMKRLKGRDENGIFSEAVENGWLWNIPLHNGRNSVGFVTEAPLPGRKEERVAAFNNAIESSENLSEMMGEDAYPIRELETVGDYSYSIKLPLFRDNLVIAGDAAGFIDPVWSTGVYLAVETARMAADAITEVRDGVDGAREKYDRDVRSLQTDYREFVKFFYGANVTQEGTFWKAYELVDRAVDEQDAFIQLVSGRMRGSAK